MNNNDLDELETINQSTSFTTGRKDARGTKQNTVASAATRKPLFQGYKRSLPRKAVKKISLPVLKFMEKKDE